MPEMQKQGTPHDRQDDEWEKDLHPDPLAGQNVGPDSKQAEKAAPTAHELKQIHTFLQDFSDDELMEIKILPLGTRLKQGAKYLDLRDPQRQEFTAMGHDEVGPENLYVPKSETSYPLWNRLRGVDDPQRLDQSD